MEISYLPVILVLVSTLLGAVGSYFFKLGSKNFSLEIYSLIRNKKLIIGFCLFGSSAFIYLFALRISKLTILYPLSSFSYIWTLFIGYFLLGEKITLLKFLGVTMILIGVSLILYSIN